MSGIVFQKQIFCVGYLAPKYAWNTTAARTQHLTTAARTQRLTICFTSGVRLP